MLTENKRIFVFDNIKALLIVLVVIGHAADYYTKDSEAMRIFFVYTYLFHMPLFIFIAGLFSKSAILKDTFKLEKVANFLILYFILKVLYYFTLNIWFGNENYSFNLLTENGVPWFMFAMAAWLCIARAVRKIPYWITLLTSLLISLAIGYTEAGDFLVLSRIFVFLPFFLLGLYIKPKALVEELQSKTLKIVSIGILLTIALVIITQIERIYTFRNILSGRNSYDKVRGLKTVTDELFAAGAFLRLFVFLITVSMCIAILALMTHKRTWFTVLGERSIAIYFFHRFLLFIYHHYGLNEQLEKVFPNAWLSIYLFTFFVVAILLAWKPFEMILRTIEKNVAKLFQPKDTLVSKKTI